MKDIGWQVAVWGLETPIIYAGTVADDLVNLPDLHHSERILVDVLGLKPKQEALGKIDDANGYVFEAITFKEIIDLDIYPLDNKSSEDVAKFWLTLRKFLRSPYKYFTIHGTDRVYYDDSLMPQNTAWRVSVEGQADVSYEYAKAQRVLRVTLRRFKPQVRRE